jgi:hypothetical protein
MNKQEYEIKLCTATQSVYTEVLREKELFTVNFHNQHEGYAAILKEIDELWTEIKKNRHRPDLKAQNKVAKQAAAMLLRFMVELT